MVSATSKHVAIIGGGPAGLAAAQVLSEAGCRVEVFDAMPSFGRKFLMAGKSGLNITHSEALDTFLSRYTAPDQRLVEMVSAFNAGDIMAWMRDLGVEPFVGTSGRVFPKEMKASPLLRARLARLDAHGVRFFRRHRWLGWRDTGELAFSTPDGDVLVRPDATVLALGGGSWKRLGSDGAWSALLEAQGVEVSPFKPSNCGFMVNWTDRVKDQFSGAPVKTIQLTAPNGQTTRSEFVITSTGVESGGIYTLSASLRDAIEHTGDAVLSIDLMPDTPYEKLLERLNKPRAKQSLTTFLRKAVGLQGVKLALLFECTSKEEMQSSDTLARAVKALPLRLTGPAPLDEAISTAGGVAWRTLDETLMLKAVPGVYCAGEMVDWDAPTGGYLITVCIAMGRAAAKGVLNGKD